MNLTTTTITNNRITTGYCEGTRQHVPGFSDIMIHERVPKSDPACGGSSGAQKMAIKATRALNAMDVEDPKAKHFYEWLKENSFAFGSYFFMKGNTDKYTLPETSLQQLEEEIKTMKLFIQNYIPTGSDFLRYEKDYNLCVDELRIYVRDLEREFVGWMYDLRVVSDFYAHLKKDPTSGLVRFNNMMHYAEFLNRLSSYFFWLNRYHNLLYLFQKNIDLVLINDSQSICGAEKQWLALKPGSLFSSDEVE